MDRSGKRAWTLYGTSNYPMARFVSWGICSFQEYQLTVVLFGLGHWLCDRTAATSHYAIGVASTFNANRWHALAPILSNSIQFRKSNH
jgi:hypothetical protein